MVKHLSPDVFTAQALIAFSTLETVNSRAEILQARMKRERAAMIYLYKLWTVSISNLNSMSLIYLS